MNGHFEDAQASLEVSPWEIRVTKLKNLWQRYKKTLWKTKTSLGDFVAYIKTYDLSLLEEIVQTQYEDFLKWWNGGENRRFAHALWYTIQSKEDIKIKQNRRHFLQTVTGTTSILVTHVLTGWDGPPMMERETAEWLLAEVIRFWNALIGDNISVSANSHFLGPVKSWVTSINFLWPKRENIVNKIAQSQYIERLGVLKNIFSKPLETEKALRALQDFRTILHVGIDDTIKEIQKCRNLLVEKVNTILEWLPDNVKQEISRNFLINRWKIKPSELVRDCILSHAENVTKSKRNKLKQEKQYLKGYTDHYHWRAIVADILEWKGCRTIEHYVTKQELSIARLMEWIIAEENARCDGIIRKLQVIEEQYNSLS